jgi:SAM-dependent methyltransferase
MGGDYTPSARRRDLDLLPSRGDILKTAVILTAMADHRFDEAYYERYYGDPETRVASAESAERLARFVCSYLHYLRIEVREVLEFGCGLGLWRAPLERAFPGVRYHGVEISEHMCAHHGWTRGSVIDHEHGRPVDLVICQGVLQYLPTSQAQRAIRNLARHAGAALYLEALTRADWEQAADQERTDGEVHLRSGAWYRRELGRHFIRCGGGLFVPKDSPVVLFELEHG